MFLALSLADTCPRPVSLPVAELRAIVAELERDEDFPAAVAGRCALCHGPLAAGEDDGTGLAHAECARLELIDIANADDLPDTFDAWWQSVETTHG